MKTFSTSGTGNQQTLSEIESDKMPVYDSLTDVEADLANLEEGQIVATRDEGSELSAPVDTVQSGNMHAVTSNAVAVALENLKVKYITVGGTSDLNGNLQIQNLPANTIPILFTSDPAGTDANYNIFYSSTALKFYVHISDFPTGAGLASATITGRVYYVKYFA